MGVLRANPGVPSRLLKNKGTRPRRCDTDRHNTRSASDLPKLWAEDEALTSRPRAPGQRRRPAESERDDSPATNDRSASGTTGNLVLLLSVEDTGKALGVCRTKVYELIGRGDLEVVHIDRSARVPVESVHAYVHRLRTG